MWYHNFDLKSIIGFQNLCTKLVAQFRISIREKLYSNVRVLYHLIKRVSQQNSRFILDNSSSILGTTLANKTRQSNNFNLLFGFQNLCTKLIAQFRIKQEKLHHSRFILDSCSSILGTILANKTRKSNNSNLMSC